MKTVHASYPPPPSPTMTCFYITNPRGGVDCFTLELVKAFTAFERRVPGEARECR